MKKILFTLAMTVLCAVGTNAAVITYDFTDKGGTFDGNTSVDVTLIDGATSVIMTVASTGGNLNSNSTRIGVGNDYIDGFGENITLTFSKAITLSLVNLSGVGSDVADGANLIAGATNVDLYTGQPNFSGGSDIYTPSVPISVTTAQFIQLTGTAATSSFGLQTIEITIVPEPTSFALIALAGLGLVARRRR